MAIVAPAYYKGRTNGKEAVCKAIPPLRWPVTFVRDKEYLYAIDTHHLQLTTKQEFQKISGIYG